MRVRPNNVKQSLFLLTTDVQLPPRFMIKLPQMKTDEREKLREYVNRWKETGEFLEKLRREEAKNLQIADDILSLADASESALRFYPPKQTSGLIEMQRLFAKLKK